MNEENEYNMEKFVKIITQYNLTVDNVVEFFLEEDGDIYKYMLKTYIMPLMENYKHILILQKYVFCDEDFDPVNEILSRKANKPSWQKILNFNSIHECFNSDRELIQRYLSFFVFLDEELEIQKDLETKISNEKNSLKRLRLEQQLLKKKKQLLKQQNRIKRSFDSEEEFKKYEKKINDFLEMAKKDVGYSMYKNKGVGDDILIEHISSCISYYIEKGNNSIWSVELLKRDLVFCYHMICKFFSKEFLNENDLSKLLHNIRVELSNFKISGIDSPDPHEHVGSTEYRTVILEQTFYDESTGIISINPFWANTSKPDEINDDMQKLFLKYQKINEISNDEEYVLASYRLTEEFLQIHPYSNGNGRTSKYLFYVLLLKRGIIPFTKTDSWVMSPCYEEIGKTENYIFARQTIFNDRLEEFNEEKRKTR